MNTKHEELFDKRVAEYIDKHHSEKISHVRHGKHIRNLLQEAYLIGRSVGISNENKQQN